MNAGDVIEFRSVDDSWYDVLLDLSGENLIVKYLDFPDENEVFAAAEYGAPEKAEELGKRFRSRSQQIQDSECSKVVPGTPVCASHALSQEALHYYDAVVDEVFYKEHSFANGEEECLCTFALLWRHGPNLGNLTLANIANICLIQPCEHMHPLVTSFITMATKNSAIVIRNPGGSDFEDLDIGQKSYVSQLAIQELKCAMQPIASKGTGLKPCERIESDTNMGEASSHHFVLVDNLEKGLAASTIVDFMHKQTSFTPQVYVFPSLSLEPYTRGIIALDCKKQFEKVCYFLDNSKHVIISSKGRPWVITGKVSTKDPMVTLLLKSQNQFRFGKAIGSELKLIYSGTREYDVAIQRKELYTDFFNHLQALRKRLVLEDNEIVKQ